MAAVGADRHTDVWPPTATYHLAHALYEPAALPPPPELRDHPDRCPPLGTGLVGGRAMRAPSYSDRSPDHHRRRVTPRSSFPVSLAVSRVRAGRRRSCRVSSLVSYLGAPAAACGNGALGGTMWEQGRSEQDTRGTRSRKRSIASAAPIKIQTAHSQ